MELLLMIEVEGCNKKSIFSIVRLHAEDTASWDEIIR